MSSKEHRFVSCSESVNVWMSSQLTKPLHSIPVQMQTRRPCTCIRRSASGNFLTFASGGVKLIKTADFSVHSIADASDVECVAFAGTSKSIVSGHKDSTVKLWDVRKRAVSSAFQGHFSAVKCLDIDTQATCVVSGSSSGDVIAHGFQTGTASKIMRTPSVQAITDVRCNPYLGHQAASSTQDGSVNLWDVVKCQLINSFEHQHGKGAAKGISYSPINEKLFATCGTNGALNFYDALDTKKLLTLTSSDSLTCLLILPDGFTVIAGTESGYLHQFDLRSPSTVGSLTRIKGHQTAVYSLAYESLGHSTASSGKHRTSRHGNLSAGSGKATSPDLSSQKAGTSSSTLKLSQQKTPESLVSGFGVISPLDKPSHTSPGENVGCFEPKKTRSVLTGPRGPVDFSSPVGPFEPKETSSVLKGPRPGKPAEETSPRKRAEADMARLMKTDPGRSRRINQPPKTVEQHQRPSRGQASSPEQSNEVLKAPSSSSMIPRQSANRSSSRPSSSVVATEVPSVPSTSSHSAVRESPGQLFTGVKNPVTPLTSSGDVTSDSHKASRVIKTTAIPSSTHGNSLGSQAVSGSRPVSAAKTTDSQSRSKEISLFSPVATASTADTFKAADEEKIIKGLTANVRNMEKGFSTTVLRNSPQASALPVTTLPTATSTRAMTTTAASSERPVMTAAHVPAELLPGNEAAQAALLSATAVAPGSLTPQLPLKFIQNMIDDSIEELRLALHRHIRDMHTDLVSQFERIEEKISELGEIEQIKEENRRLREENRRLRKS